MTDQAQQSAENARAVQSAEMVGKPMLPIAFFIIYGIYRVTEEGIWPSWPNGTILVVGGIVSMLFVVLYVRSIETGPGASWAKAASVFGGLVPYLFSLYVIGYVGIGSLIQLITVGFSWSGLAAGLFGAVFGYRTLKTFYDITELAKA
ncbi:hypothetical protein [Rhizobium leguminosarum]|uniref:hypothetical protein n=1 Tax=Rhizobium leguminosarum TaxID=384 RepID=UPI00103A6E3F|nr:hypothetical protein [Rhizobium leguminosarum]TCA26246.1 hypothetical protein E0H67_04825 [Rhizobium leguminosarum bv. viciae]